MIMSIKRRSRWVWLFIAQAKIFCSLFLQDLSIKYKYLRRTRGDGNCFFRAFAFSFLETLLHNKTELERSISRCQLT